MYLVIFKYTYIMSHNTSWSHSPGFLVTESASGVLKFLTMESESHKNTRTPHPWLKLVRPVCHQLVTHLKTNSLLPDLQSAFRAHHSPFVFLHVLGVLFGLMTTRLNKRYCYYYYHHSTKTAVLKVMSDILLALESGNLALLTLLDLSAAFDIDHATLIHRVQKSNGLIVYRLHLNREKTEALWCSSARRQHQIPTRPVRVGCTSVQPVTAARNLGIYLHGVVSMRTHVTTTVRACFAMLHQIRSVRHSLPRPAMLTMLRSLVINQLGSCSSVMAGAPDVQLHRLQSVLNAAVRLVFSACVY